MAVLLLVEQTASKAARDALFLGAFEPERLGPVMIAGAILSIGAVISVGRAHARHPPESVLALVLVGSAVLFAIETGLSWTHHPHVAAVVVYLHVTALGALVVSSFWTIVSARWDPHVAKREIVRLAAWAALGGVLGGLVAELSSHALGPRLLLPLLAGASLVTAVLVRKSRSGGAARSTRPSSEPPPGPREIVRSGYLRSLALLAMLVAIWEAPLDFAFKSAAHDALGDERALVRFFGLFYMAVSVATLAVQSTIGRVALRRGRVAVTAAATPLVVSFGFLSLFGASFPLFVALRAGESLTSNSLLRSAYEVYFHPIPSAVVRATKTFVDVAATRVGDVIGASLVLALVTADVSRESLLVVAASLGVLGLLLLPLVDRGYVAALASLLRQGVEGGSTTTVPAIAAVDEPAPTHVVPRLAVAARVAALESGRLETIRRALVEPLEPALVRIALPLVAHRLLRAAAVRAVRSAAPRATGALLDALFDPETPPEVRARIPGLLRSSEAHRAVPGLLQGLDDPHLDVRLECARGLAHLASAAAGLIDRDRVVEAIQRECAEHGPSWAQGGHEVDEDGEEHPLERLLDREVARSLRCALILVSLTIDAHELELALRGLASDDAAVRGTAFELLSNVLPEPVREPLLRGLGPDRPIRLVEPTPAAALRPGAA